MIVTSKCNTPFTFSGRGRGISRGGHTPGYVPRGGNHAYNGGAAFNSREFPTSFPPGAARVRPFDPCAFVGDYDFEEANSRFVPLVLMFLCAIDIHCSFVLCRVVSFVFVIPTHSSVPVVKM